ncbi:MAG: hypothetical protein J7M25_16995 [Deltaproteobacteria bacterium]|nr:hypothetical protein [Deltaproteobacteria bacterium]
MIYARTGQAGRTRHWPANLLGLVGALLIVTVLGGCHGFSVKTPGNFVRLKRTSRRVVQVAPDNTVIVTRMWKNNPKGDASFWTQTVRRDFEKVRGYTFVGMGAVKTASGLNGKELRFEGAYRGGVYAYRVALFVTGDFILSVELLAQKKAAAKYEKSYKEVVASLKFK